MPSSVIIFMTFFNGVKNPLSTRIAVFNVEIASVVLRVEMLIVMPHLKRIIMDRWRQNQVAPDRNTVAQ